MHRSKRKIIKNQVLRSFLHPFNPRWLFKTVPIDAPLFLTDWENRWAHIADPTNEEVFQRIQQIGGKSVAEIGAGYGRVSKYLASKGLTVFPIEPDKFLLEKIEVGAVQSGVVKPVIQANASAIPYLPVDLYFSVRALEYCNFIQLSILSYKLKKYGKGLLAWERKGASARIRIAALLTLNKNIWVQDLIK